MPIDIVGDGTINTGKGVENKRSGQEERSIAELFGTIGRAFAEFLPVPTCVIAGLPLLALGSYYLDSTDIGAVAAHSSISEIARFFQYRGDQLFPGRGIGRRHHDDLDHHPAAATRGAAGGAIDDQTDVR